MDTMRSASRARGRPSQNRSNETHGRTLPSFGNCSFDLTRLPRKSNDFRYGCYSSDAINVAMADRYAENCK